MTQDSEFPAFKNNDNFEFSCALNSVISFPDKSSTSKVVGSWSGKISVILSYLRYSRLRVDG